MYKAMMTVAAATLLSSVAMAQTNTPNSQMPGSVTPHNQQQPQNCATITNEAQRTACMNQARSGTTGTGSGNMSTGSPPASSSGSSPSGSMNTSPSGGTSSGSGSGTGGGTTR